jgi:hypothetical protein
MDSESSDQDRARDVPEPGAAAGRADLLRAELEEIVVGLSLRIVEDGLEPGDEIREKRGPLAFRDAAPRPLGIDLEITDSSFNELVLSPFTIFLAAGFSERSSEGFIKSAPVSGHPGFEKWNNESRRADVTVVVGNRFIVQAIGRNVDSVDPVRALVKSVDLAKLASLK